MDKLFADFENVSKEDWLSKITADAKGKSISDFDWHINEQLSQSPFVRSSDLNSSVADIKRSEQGNHWRITERIAYKDPTQTNKQIINSLEHGASALILSIDNKLDKSQFAELFRDVNFTYIHTTFEVVDIELIDSLLSYLINFANEHQQALNEITGSIRIKHQLFFDDSTLAGKYAKSLPGFSFAYVASDQLFAHKETIIHEAGELCLSLKKIIENGVSGSYLDLEISVGKSYLLSIAKLRAIHIVINNLQQIYESSLQIRIHGNLSSHSMSDNENQNLIQFASQAMSAVVGGVYSLYLPASDSGIDEGNTVFRTRLSRNIQSIMQMESFMNKVEDPAGGSYYIESLTDQIAEQVWGYMQNHS